MDITNLRFLSLLIGFPIRRAVTIYLNLENRRLTKNILPAQVEGRS